jgi:hypothetical protein
MARICPPCHQGLQKPALGNAAEGATNTRRSLVRLPAYNSRPHAIGLQRPRRREAVQFQFRAVNVVAPDMMAVTPLRF